MCLTCITQLDACTTGDQEVAGSTPTGLATFFHGNLIIKYFLQSFSLPLIQEGQLSVSEKCAQYWLTT